MTIKIKNLSFYAIIGILPFERKNKQRVIIDCKLKYKYKNQKFIDYAQVAQEIEKIIKNKKFELLEDAIICLKNHIKANYNVKKVSISISKPDILDNCTVSLSK